MMLPAAFAGPAASAFPHTLQTAFRDSLDRLLDGRKMQVGVAVIVDGRDTLVYGNSGRYPMMSVFKFHQALAVADRLERDGLSLAAVIPFGRADLAENTWSPLRDRYPQGCDTLTVADLLRYTLQSSDNNACDILFRRIAGVAETDRYIRSLGIADFGIVADEEQMHRNPDLCYRNWSSPLAAAELLDWLVTDRLGTGPAYDFVRETMTACETGLNRLPMPFRNGNGGRAVLGHKTGTSDRNREGAWTGINDIGFVFLPESGRRYVIAVFVRDSFESLEETEHAIGEISGLVFRLVSAGRE